MIEEAPTAAKYVMSRSYDVIQGKYLVFGCYFIYVVLHAINYKRDVLGLILEGRVK